MLDWQADLFRPPFAGWVTASLLLLVGGAMLLLYVRRSEPVGMARRAVMVALRGAALVALAWVLMGPSVLQSTAPESVRTPLRILIDTSASMAERDMVLAGQAAPVSRWESLRANWLTDETLALLSEVADVQLVGFDERVGPLEAHRVGEVTPAGTQTRLLDAVRQSMDASAGDRAEPKPTLLLLSDGHDTGPAGAGGADMTKLTDSLTRWGGRLYAVPVGAEEATPDAAVQAWADADHLFDGQSTRIHGTVFQRGFGDRAARVDLLHDGRVISSRQVAFEGKPSQSVAFSVTPTIEPGQPVTAHGYEVRATLIEEGEKGAGESYLDNNVRPVFLQVSRERIRVLLLEGEPYWDTRFLAQGLREDPHVDLTAIYHLGDNRELRIASEDSAADASPASALTSDGLSNYDVVVLGKRVERLVPDVARVVDYVQRRGGALVLARGQPFDDPIAQQILSPIAPVVWGEQAVGDLSLQVTPEGVRSPLLRFEEVGPTDAILTRLPGMIAATRVVEERAASVVLLRQAPARSGAPPMAAVAHQHAGAGQVMAVLTDGLWRWALLPDVLDQYDSVYHLFWARAIRWLATGGEFLPGQEVALTLDRLTLEPEETVGLTVTTRFVDPAYRPVIRVTAPDGEVHTIHPQPTGEGETRHEATFRPRDTGIYHVELDRPAGQDERAAAATSPIRSRFAVFEASTERLDPSARPELLDALAAASGGRSLGLDEVDELVTYLDALRHARAADASATYDFTRPWALIAILGCLGLEWILRRRAGLL